MGTFESSWDSDIWAASSRLRRFIESISAAARAPTTSPCCSTASPADESARKFAVALIEGVRGEQVALDKLIADALEHWSVKRLSRVDHNIMRMALYELLRMEDIPARVTIDEAIELAKSYGDIQSGRFVNGVLDEIAGKLGLKNKGEEVAISKSE